jgi:DNA-directed RNA polymerase specialized sigma subunit
MKTFREISEAKTNTFDLQEDTVNYLSQKQLTDYRDITNKFLMQETRNIIEFLIKNNASYISELPGADKDENALAGFYKSKMPKQEKYQQLWRDIHAVVSAGRTLEIPVFQTREQFDAVINHKASLDEIVIDLTSEKSRNEIVEKYKPLIWKMVNSWNKKCTLSIDELYSAALEGMTWAMNYYGKGKGGKVQQRRESTLSQEELDELSKKMHSSMTFGQYAAYKIRVAILEAIKNESRTVRVAVSAQQREYKKNGSIKTNNTVSGNKTVSTDKDGNGKTMFDFIGSAEDASRELDNQDLQKLWEDIFKKLEQTFDKKIMDVWYSYNGLNGYEKMKNKEIAKKYKVVPSNISYYLNKVNNFIRTDKKLYSMISDVYELMRECLHDRDEESDEMIPVVESHHSSMFDDDEDML